MNSISIQEETFSLPSFQEVTNKDETYWFKEPTIEFFSKAIFNRTDSDITAGIWNDTEKSPVF